MKITTTFSAIMATLLFFALPAFSAAQSAGSGTPPPAPAAQPKGHNTTTGTVEPGKTDTLPDGTKATHEDVDGPDGTMTWKHCDGNDGDHDPHTEITTSKASGHLEGDGYTLTMKSKSKITAKGNDTDVHHKSGSTGSTFSGEGNNNHGHLHGGNNPITWSGKNNTNTNS